MNTTIAGGAVPAAPAALRERAWRLLLPLCFVSGCAALIYEVLWFQLLSFVIGASAVSLGIVLATFMGGLTLGSLLLSRSVSQIHHPLRVFAWLELGIGAAGIALLYAMPAIGAGYAALAGPGVSGTPGLILRAAVAVACLLPPTVLMGATLPALARFVETTPRGVRRIGLLYGANIGGAVAGSLVAGFYLLRVHDVAVATFAAAGLNVLVAGASFVAAGLAAYRAAGRSASVLPAERSHASEAPALPTAASQSAAPEVSSADTQVSSADSHLSSTASAVPSSDEPPVGAAPSEASHLDARPVYVTIALSGATALAAQVIWTRHLSLLLGATVYTFALILAVFLLGLGLGSAAGVTLSRRVPARVALGACQWLLCATIFWAAYVIARSLPYWPLDVTLPTAPGVSLQLDLLRVAWAVLPAALLWGASFPLALAAVASQRRDPARLIGGLYASNTLGAIVGAIAGSFVLVPWLGSLLTQQLLIAVAAVSALLVLWSSQAPAEPRSLDLSAEPRSLDLRAMPHRLGARRAAWSTAAAVGAASLALGMPELPGELIAFGRFMPTRAAESDVIFKREGIASSIAVSRDPNGHLTYHNAGKAQASTYVQDLRLQRMLGHLTTLVPEQAESFLVIGLGAGVTAGAVAVDPAVERVVVAEIEPLVGEVASAYFAPQNFGVLSEPKVELRIDDGRHFLATTDETFDGITSDPLDPWVKGAASLYTREFWELVESRLNPGGVVTVFLQLYENTEDAVRSEIATFFDVFENGAVFANTIQGTGYDAVLLARVGGAPIDLDLLYARLRAPEYALVAQSLREVGFHSAVDLLGTYAGRRSDLFHWLDGAAINRDRNLRLQYLAGEGLNLYRADPIYAAMIAKGVEFPADLFVGSRQRIDELRRAIVSRARPTRNR